MEDTYIRNSYIEGRLGENPVYLSIDPETGTQQWVVRLDRYAIVPLEQYEELKARAVQDPVE